jgi:hypothetical protein
MAYLTETQAELLDWMVESASGPYVPITMAGGRRSIRGTQGGEDRELDHADLLELARQNLIQQTPDGKAYVVTNDGLVEYARRREPPPPEPPEVGFRPSG